MLYHRTECIVEIGHTESIDALKLKIYDKSGIRPEFQILRNRNKILDNLIHVETGDIISLHIDHFRIIRSRE